MEAVLRGITWGHSRGITPLLAASQRYEELYPGVQIQWTKRTLQEFADYPLEKLTEKYDLLIIDHPWVGCAGWNHYWISNLNCCRHIMPAAGSCKEVIATMVTRC